MPEAAKVAFVAISLAFVAVRMFLYVTSVYITILLLVTVEARLSMLLSSISMKAKNWGGIVVSLAPVIWPVEWWQTESGMLWMAEVVLAEPKLFLPQSTETRATRLRASWEAMKTFFHSDQLFLTAGRRSHLGRLSRNDLELRREWKEMATSHASMMGRLER